MKHIDEARLEADVAYRVDRETEMRTVRAFNKLLWLQSDLITRHYQDAGELAETAAA